MLLARSLDLVGGTLVAIDGAFFHGDASKASILTKKRLQEQMAALDQALAGAAPGGGRWTAANVAAWMSQQIGRPVAEETGWRYLRRLEWRRYRPRPQHAKADVAAQAAFVQTGSASR